MKHILWIAALCVCYSCSSKFYTGIYGSPDLPYSFEFKDDGTFHYRYQSFFMGLESNGTWKANSKNTIILDSYIKEKKLKLREEKGNLEVNPDSSIKGSRLTINANIPKAQHNYYECLIYIDDSLYEIKNCDSLQFIKTPSKINDIYLKIHSYSKMPGRFYDTLTTEKYFPRISRRIYADVVFNDSIFNYQVFDSARYYFTKHTLKFYDKATKKWIRIPHVKHSLDAVSN